LGSLTQGRLEIDEKSTGEKPSVAGLQEIWETDGWTPEFDRQLEAFIWWVARRHGGQADDDLIQDVKLKVVEALPDYDPDLGRFDSYIYSLARNRVSAQARARRVAGERQAPPEMLDDLEAQGHDDYYAGLEIDPTVAYRLSLVRDLEFPGHWFETLDGCLDAQMKLFVRVLQEVAGPRATAAAIFCLAGLTVEVPGLRELARQHVALVVEREREADEEFNAAVMAQAVDHPVVQCFLSRMTALGFDRRLVKRVLKETAQA